MTGYRARELQRVRRDLVRALEQLTFVCEREDTEAGIRCAYAAVMAHRAADRLDRAARALDPKFAELERAAS